MAWLIGGIAAVLALAVAKLRKRRTKAGECWTLYGRSNIPNLCSAAAETTLRQGIQRQGNELASFDCHDGEFSASVRYKRDGVFLIGKLQIPRDLLRVFGLKGSFWIQVDRAELCKPGPPEPKPEPGPHPEAVA